MKISKFYLILFKYSLTGILINVIVDLTGAPGKRPKKGRRCRRCQFPPDRITQPFAAATSGQSSNISAPLAALAGQSSRGTPALEACRLRPPFQALLACGLVSETGRGASTQAGGRKPVLLSFNPTYRYILTVHLKRKALHLILCDLYGHRKNALSLRFPTGAGADAGLPVSPLLLRGVPILQSNHARGPLLHRRLLPRYLLSRPPV